MIQVVNWPKFQHYKGRRPPWIKMYRDLLDRREWHALSGDASKLLAECWLLAAEYDGGMIPLEVAALTWRLRRTEPARVLALLQEIAQQGFITLSADLASNALAECQQVATPEVETEVEKRKEKKPSASKRKAALSEEWKPNDAHRKLAATRNVDLAHEEANFRDHAKANGRLQLDWDASFRTWLRNARPVQPAKPHFGDETARDNERRAEAIRRQSQREAEQREAEEAEHERELADLWTWWEDVDADTRLRVLGVAKERCKNLPVGLHRSVTTGVMLEHRKAQHGAANGGPPA